MVTTIKYKLYKPVDDSLATQTQVLTNRGIPREKINSWLAAGWESINDPSLLDDDNKLTRAVNLVEQHVRDNKNILVLIDADQDGFGSSALFINYLTKRYPDYASRHVQWILHGTKAHGFKDTVDRILEKKPDLVISPDGSSNDFKEQKRLNENGIKVVILDHHDVDKDHTNNDTIVINVQLSKYPNKALTGGGVVWQFCRLYDRLHPSEDGSHAQEFIDLAAIADCGDMANYREFEIRALMNLGLSYIHNPFYATLAKTNDFSIQKMNGINYYSCAFYIVPFINAVTRSGTPEEQEFIFESSLLLKAFDKVPSSKRGEKDILVPRYQEAVTLVQRIKRRQTKLQDETMSIIDKKIEEQSLSKNAIIAVVLEPDECEASLCGLCGNKIQAKYQHPALVLRDMKVPEYNENVYMGSARNYSNCEIANMRSLCASTGDMLLAAGHEGAWGASILSSKFNEFIEKTNKLYKNIDFTPTYWVDYIWKPYDIDTDRILDLGRLNIYGQEIPESLVVVEDIILDENKVSLMGKNKNTIKIMCGSVACILFQTDEAVYQDMISGNKKITIVGKGNCNRWNGNVSPQIIIEDYELTEEKWIF